MPDLSSWAQYLNDPFVLIGFAIMLFTGVMTVILKKNLLTLSKAGTQKILQQLFLYAFLLILATIILVGVISVNNTPAVSNSNPGTNDNVQQPEPASTAPATTKPAVNEIKTEGDQSPVIIGGEGNVEVNFGDNNKKDGE